MSRIIATFAIRTAFLKPEVITKLLSYAPDSIVIKGLARVPPRTMPPLHGWVVRDMLESGSDPGGALSTLFQRVSPLLSRVHLVRAADPTTDIWFSVTLTPYRPEIPFDFSPELLRGITLFGADFDIEFFEGGDAD